VSFLYLARHKPSLDVVSLKYTDLSLSPDSEFVEELIKSTQNSVLLRHVNILPYLVTFVDNEHLWSVTQPMHFGSCRLIMKARFPDGFTEPVVATVLMQVLKALLYMHSNHYIHKFDLYLTKFSDIRADNILVDSNGEVRLTGLRQVIDMQQDGRVRTSVFSLVGNKIEWTPLKSWLRKQTLAR
jgi:serine/threonine protein kinase